MTTDDLAKQEGPPHPVADLRSMAPGSHLCSFFADEGELARVAAAFVGSGLDVGDQVLYVASDRTPAGVQASLEASGAATGAHVASGQLLVRSFSEVYGADGGLDLAQIATDLRTAIGHARDDGFPGLRFAAEMGDFAQAFGSIELLLLWERMCSRLHQEEGLSSVCQYDQRRFDDREQLSPIAVEHGGLAPDSAPEPLVRFLATKKPWGLRLTGELDASSRAAFGRALRARLAARARLRLDVRDLSFIDVGSLADIYECAATLPWHGRIVLAGAAAQLRHLVELAEFSHPRLVIEP